MPLGWVVLIAFVAFLAGWFLAGAMHVGRAEDIYREGYAKGLEEGARSKSPVRSQTPGKVV